MDTATAPTVTQSDSLPNIANASGDENDSGSLSLASALQLTPPRAGPVGVGVLARRRTVSLAPLKLLATTPPRKRMGGARNIIVVNGSPSPSPPRRPQGSRTKGSSNASMRARGRSCPTSPRKLVARSKSGGTGTGTGIGSPSSSSASASKVGSPKRKRTTMSSTFGIRSVLGNGGIGNRLAVGLGRLKFGSGSKAGADATGKFGGRATGVGADAGHEAVGADGMKGGLRRRVESDVAMPIVSPGAASVFGGDGYMDENTRVVRAVKSQFDLGSAMTIDGGSNVGLHDPALGVQYAGCTVTGGGNMGPTSATMGAECDDMMLSPSNSMLDSPMFDRSRFEAKQDELAKARTKKLLNVLGLDALEEIRRKSELEGWEGV